MDESILTSIKKLLGIGEYDDNFDTDVIMHINSVLSILQQLGVGPRMGYSITGDTETWSDFLEPNDDRINMVKTYIYLRVRLLFDPPTNSFVTDAITKQYQEIEWRLQVTLDEVKEPYYEE